ncbi:hypothetical protein Taro_050537 [Colocasia esculenta]|uniref:Uncharacterized protein n=1 Tax=Colocasia esculenta TaxID=4460 RepID=A0A843XE26_COLES|nr:hypothetical protein [Colocasia esculenta]
MPFEEGRQWRKPSRRGVADKGCPFGCAAKRTPGLPFGCAAKRNAEILASARLMQVLYVV